MFSYEEYITAQIIAGAIGGLLGAARNLKKDNVNDTIFQKIISVLIGTVFGIAAAEYFAGDLHPVISLIIGMLAGGVGGVALDVFQSTFPSLASSILEGWATKIGAGDIETKKYPSHNRRIRQTVEPPEYREDFLDKSEIVDLKEDDRSGHM